MVFRKVKVRQKAVRKIPDFELPFLSNENLKKEFCRLRKAERKETEFFPASTMRSRGLEILSILKERGVSNRKARSRCPLK